MFKSPSEARSRIPAARTMELAYRPLHWAAKGEAWRQRGEAALAPVQRLPGPTRLARHLGSERPGETAAPFPYIRLPKISAGEHGCDGAIS
jgi:hypothetical protein